MAVRHHIKVVELAAFVGLFIVGLAMIFLSLIFPSLPKDIVLTVGGVFIGQITMIIPTYEHAKEDSKKHQEDAFASFLLGHNLGMILMGYKPDPFSFGQIKTWGARIGLNSTEIENSLKEYIDSFQKESQANPSKGELTKLMSGVMQNIKGHLTSSHPELFPFYMLGSIVIGLETYFCSGKTLSDDDKKLIRFVINDQMTPYIREAKKYNKNLTAINELEEKVFQAIIKLKENIPNDTKYLFEVCSEVLKGVTDVEKWYYNSLASWAK